MKNFAAFLFCGVLTAFSARAETVVTTTTTTTVSVDYTMHIDMTSVKQHKASSPKLVGWIYIPDTVIDYPIMQAEDNNYFLHLDWMEQESLQAASMRTIGAILTKRP